MDLENVFVAMLLFFGLFAGGSSFQQSFLEEQGVQVNESTPLEQEYSELQDNIDEIRKEVRKIQQPDTGLLDSAVAGLYLVPKFLGILLSPITILGSTLETIGATYWFVPEFLTTMLKYILYLGITMGGFRLLIGLRSG